jgi:hypothetical protein
VLLGLATGCATSACVQMVDTWPLSTGGHCDACSTLHCPVRARLPLQP